MKVEMTAEQRQTTAERMVFLITGKSVEELVKELRKGGLQGKNDGKGTHD